MPASPGKFLRPACGLVLLGQVLFVLSVTGAVGAAWAQQAPIRLEPIGTEPPPKATGLIPPEERGIKSLEEKKEEDKSAAVTGTGIQVDALQSIDVDTVGVLNEAQGGFGAAMWNGTSRALVDSLLPRLPVSTTSPTMRDLMRRMLLSTAAVPKGKSKGQSLVRTRIELLAAMGNLRAVNDLLEATPARHQDEALMRIEADMRFLANDNARACALAAGQFQADPNPYWHKAFIFCQALAGETEKAALGVGLLSEEGEKDDPFFIMVDGLTSGGKVAIESLSDPSPLHLAIARAAKAQLPADVISSNRPAVLRTIAISPNAPIELRLEAAERAEAAGALTVDALRQLYTSASFSEEALANPLSRAEAETGPLSRALLYRTSLAQTVPMAQAEAVARALSLGREGGRYTSTVRVFVPVLQLIRPSDELMWFAPQAIRALLASGRHELAGQWFEMLRASAISDENSVTMLSALMPVASLSGSSDSNDWTTEKLTDWWDQAKGDSAGSRRAAILYSLFESIGEPVPTALWDQLLTDAERTTVALPHPALWYRLQAAAQSGRRGETILLSLLALGEGGPGQADPVILRQVLTGLRAIGLVDEARALAVEAAVAVGL